MDLVLQTLQQYISYLRLEKLNQRSKMSQVWFITGTSSGFGQAFALEALERGDRVIASARNATSRPELEKLKEKGAKLLDLDVTAPKMEIEAKMKEAVAIYGHIDFLVNNAGYVEMGFIEELEYVNISSIPFFQQSSSA